MLNRYLGITVISASRETCFFFLRQTALSDHSYPVITVVKFYLATVAAMWNALGVTFVGLSQEV